MLRRQFIADLLMILPQADINHTATHFFQRAKQPRATFWDSGLSAAQEHQAGDTLQRVRRRDS